jgi:hypothetical protein
MATKHPPSLVEQPAANDTMRRPLDDAFKAAMEHDSREAASRSAVVLDASP